MATNQKYDYEQKVLQVCVWEASIKIQKCHTQHLRITHRNFSLCLVASRGDTAAQST